MKKVIITSILALLVTVWSAMGAPDRQDEYLGLPGDNLNLYAVMKLFQESETLETFERDLNSEDSRINNLDLNGDNMVDYLTVSDYVDGNVHNIVLRAYLNQNESQDVAVFIVEQLRNGEVRIQLVGDEALYGKNYIIEPNYAETPNPGYTGRASVAVVGYTYYDIATWPVIRYMYHPGYIVWRSSWRWGYYPVYWHPWRTHYWHFYYGYHYNWFTYYHSHYRPWKRVRWHRYDRFYCNHVRVYSPTVVVNINRGVYRDTYSRPDRRRAGEQLYARTRPATRSNTSTAVRSRTETRQGQGNTVSRRSTNARSDARQVTRGSTRSATRTEARPVTRSNTRSATRSEARPVTRSNTRSATRTEARPVTRSSNRSATRTVTRSGQQNISSGKATTGRRTTVTAPARQSSNNRSTQARASQRSSSSRQKAAVKSNNSSRRSAATVSGSGKARSSNSKAVRSSQSASRSKKAVESKARTTRRK